MEISKHDTDGPAVNRGIDAATISFSEEPALAASGGSHRFALRVTCSVTRFVEFHRSGQDPVVLLRRCTGVVARGSATTFPVDDLSALQSDTACRGALRGMLEQLPQLRSLWLAEDEWDAVVPADIVPQIVRVARGDDAKDGFTFCFAMKVHRRIIYGEQALLMACKERELDLRAAKTDDCAICLNGLEGEPAVELPTCEHAFHRRCISTWFSKATTCPMCRGDVRLRGLLKFLNL
ncbi:RING finger protein 215-like [Hordeum vulgare subsp. vulgare]|uniref:RING-type E3 ubiquitin transferase n=1 Tax=Hordeum vulgare subsp. vulgare TaxID=112509 RepID=A0A8I6XQY3_HORVV|nr:RING finger protein 215-like [Hordeum vulgare subsp. vulgare]